MPPLLLRSSPLQTFLVMKEKRLLHPLVWKLYWLRSNTQSPTQEKPSSSFSSSRIFGPIP